MKSIKNLINKIRAKYAVVAWFDNQTAIHYAKDWNDVVEWMKCYNHSDMIGVYESFLGRIAIDPIAVRHESV